MHKVNRWLSSVVKVGCFRVSLPQPWGLWFKTTWRPIPIFFSCALLCWTVFFVDLMFANSEKWGFDTTLFAMAALQWWCIDCLHLSLSVSENMVIRYWRMNGLWYGDVNWWWSGVQEWVHTYTCLIIFWTLINKRKCDLVHPRCGCGTWYPFLMVS